MYKQSPSRNQRSKGIKVKHVLQICLLLAICFWLLYQVKHSHDKKKEFDEDDTKTSLDTGSDKELVKFGRKDLHPRLKETVLEDEKRHEEVEEQETAGEEEDNNHEEEKEDGMEEKEEDITEEKDSEGREGGNDEIDEHDQEKSDGEVDQEEDTVDEEKEREEHDESETEEKDSEENSGEMENENSSEDHDHEHDGDSTNTREAREEQYKADDASSAVTHDTQVISAENENTSLDKEHGKETILENEIRNNSSEGTLPGESKIVLTVEDGEMVEKGGPLNATNNEEKDSQHFASQSQDSLLPNSTTIEDSNNNQQRGNNSTETSEEAHKSSLLEESHSLVDSSKASNVTTGEETSGEGMQSITLGQGNKSTTTFNNQSDSSATLPQKSEEESNPGYSLNSSDSVKYAEELLKTNTSAGTEDNPHFSTIESSREVEAEKLDNGEESLDSSIVEDPGETQHDPIDSSDSSVALEDKDILTDLGTLPEIQTEGSNSEDVAAE